MSLALQILTSSSHKITSKQLPSYYWDSYLEDEYAKSVPAYVEKHADRLRKKYVYFIQDLSEAKIKNISLFEHLSQKNGFNLWWMSLLAEKSYFKSPRIIDCLKLLALQEILLEEKPERVLLLSENRDLASAIEELCISLRINFCWKREYQRNIKFKVKTLYHRSPHFVQALVWLFYHLISCWSLRRIKKADWFRDRRSIFFFSYFIHLDSVKCQEGQFYSKQWEMLPDYLQSIGIKTNWLHHFLHSADIPDTKTALTWTNWFNKEENQQGRHRFLGSYIDLFIVVKTLYHFLILTMKNWSWYNVGSVFSATKNGVGMWHLLKKDWYSSVRGKVAIENLFWIELLDKAIALLPRQELGLYLQENQGWERAFIHAWRRHGHGRLIGVPHSTIRYWDLRYFENGFVGSGPVFPLPDFVALNGPAAKKSYLKMDYPQEKIIDVEALRYLHLQEVLDQKNIKIYPQEKSKKRVLIVGDYLYGPTHAMLKCAEQAFSEITDEYQLIFKPHPSCVINLLNYPLVKLSESNQPLHELVSSFDVAIGSYGSACLEIYLMGLAVLVFVQDGDFVFSSLRGIEEVQFFNTSEELTKIYFKLDSGKKVNREKPDFFWLDKDIPRWKNLLKESGCSLN